MTFGDLNSPCEIEGNLKYLLFMTTEIFSNVDTESAAERVLITGAMCRYLLISIPVENRDMKIPSAHDERLTFIARQKSLLSGFDDNRILRQLATR